MTDTDRLDSFRIDADDVEWASEVGREFAMRVARLRSIATVEDLDDVVPVAGIIEYLDEHIAEIIGNSPMMLDFASGVLEGLESAGAHQRVEGTPEQEFLMNGCVERLVERIDGLRDHDDAGAWAFVCGSAFAGKFVDVLVWAEGDVDVTFKNEFTRRLREGLLPSLEEILCDALLLESFWDGVASKEESLSPQPGMFSQDCSPFE